MGGWLKKLVHVNGGPEARGVRKNATLEAGAEANDPRVFFLCSSYLLILLR